MISLQQISYSHPNKDVLFQNINLSLAPQEKASLVGQNAVGKSSLLKLITKELAPTTGSIILNEQVYLVPQHYGQFNNLSLAEALGIDKKMTALTRIIEGSCDEQDFTDLEDDWTIETRVDEALKTWGLENTQLDSKLTTLSGGQKTKLFLAGITIHQPKIILMDEPSNHLDSDARKLLYDIIRSINSTLLIVSHDRELLDLLDYTLELSPTGIKRYGGNYTFFQEQKTIETESLNKDIEHYEKEIRKAKNKAREVIERNQKASSRGRAQKEKEGIPKIMLNGFKNKAENSAANLKDLHDSKISQMQSELEQLRLTTSNLDQMKLAIAQSILHQGKTLVRLERVNVQLQSDKLLWDSNLSFQLTSGMRVAVHGKNGSGKSTLLKLILGNIKATTGTATHFFNTAHYIDQEYSLLNNDLTIAEQAYRFNDSALATFEVNGRLQQFLFTYNDWDKSIKSLSGGERLRLTLCCISLQKTPPEIILLDEPTNNLDIQNIEILTNAIKAFKGTLIVVSHDKKFLQDIHITEEIAL